MSEHTGWAAIGQNLFAGTPMPADDDPTPPEPIEPGQDPFEQWVTDSAAAAEAKQRAAAAAEAARQFREAHVLAPVIPGQGSTPAPPEGMSPDTRAMLDQISAPHLRSL